MEGLTEGKATDYIMKYYRVLLEEKEWRLTIDAIESITISEKKSINILLRRGTTRPGKMIGRKGVFINKLADELKEEFGDEVTVHITQPAKWYCPTCSIEFRHMKQLRKHLVAREHNRNYSDNDLSLDRKILGTCKEILTDGTLCDRTLFNRENECSKCMRMKNR